MSVNGNTASAPDFNANMSNVIKAIDAPAYPTLKKPLKRYKPKRGTTISVAATQLSLQVIC